MSTHQGAEQALDHFVESLAHELAEAIQSDDAEHFHSHFEQEAAVLEERFRVTLRHRLQELLTQHEIAADRQVEEGDRGIPTIDYVADKQDAAVVDGLAMTEDYGNPAQRVMVRIPMGRDRALPAKSRRRVDSTTDLGFRQEDLPPDYRILGRLGHGGMGVVFKALHLPLQRIVAVKLILAGSHASGAQIARFRTEAQAAAQLVHPNIVQVYSVGEHRGFPYFASEYVEGAPLDERLKDLVMPSDKAAELMRQVTRAVQYSHEHGVIHRDLKPNNILMSKEDVPKVADFGLAKRLNEDDGGQTGTGDVLGTPGYMAPEQARGESTVGPRSDVYSLGALLYYVLTGRPPFVSASAMDAIQQTLYHEPVSPSRLRPELNRDLETICLKCLEKEPNGRYQTAAELADEFDRVCRGIPILARPITAHERAWKWCKRNPRVASLTAIAASLLLTVLVGGYVAAGVINTQRVSEKSARDRADIKAEEAGISARIAKDQQALAEDQADLAAEATRVVLYNTQEYFKNNPQLAPLRQKMLDGIVEKLERVYASIASYNVKETFRATAIRQLGEVYLEAGLTEEALKKFLESESIAKKMHAEGQLSRPALSFGTLDRWIGDAYKQLGDPVQAKTRYLSMIEHRKEHFRQEPEFDSSLAAQSMAEAYGKLAGVVRQLGDTDEAVALSLQVVAARRTWFDQDPNEQVRAHELEGSLNDLSVSYEHRAEFDEMLKAGREALKLSRLSTAGKSDHASIFNLAKNLKTLGRQTLQIGQIPEATKFLEEATRTFEAALRIAPNHYSTQSQASEAYYLLATAQSISGAALDAACSRGLELVEQCLKKSNSTSNQGMQLKLLARTGRVDEAAEKATTLSGDRTSVDPCLYAAIGYAVASEHLKDQPPRRQEFLDKAVELVRVAVDDLGFSQHLVLRHDIDFAPLRELPQFQTLIEMAKLKTETTK